MLGAAPLPSAVNVAVQTFGLVVLWTRLLSVPPTGVMSSISKPLTASLNVKLIVVDSVAVSAGSRAVITKPGANVSTVRLSVAVRLALPATSVTIPAGTFTTTSPSKSAAGTSVPLKLPSPLSTRPVNVPLAMSSNPSSASAVSGLPSTALTASPKSIVIAFVTGSIVITGAGASVSTTKPSVPSSTSPVPKLPARSV
ncbi:Uncharacterised protein [Acinetobacter baumannii]|nr:Uncharacterized protein AB71192_04076 [Acinetobacter baumannii]SSQ62087.1 Uncharacterised protein [Acinetobacter baumannii]SSR36549.1 Uncharacterised protein [Acinetobacter baumannii]SSS47789.1 Uncharacterised protein [Acinetobacter baumannii]SSU91554.1 Uncharacterised protein [Acinetobacter baumannii]